MVLAALMALLPMGITSPPEAKAAVTCTSYDSNYWDGFFQGPNDGSNHFYEGASAYIVVRVGAICNPGQDPSSFTAQYVMIGDGDSRGLGQVGTMRRYGYPLRWFAEFDAGDGTGFVRRFSAGGVESEIGKAHAFRVVYGTGCACLVGRVDNYEIGRSSFSPYSKWSSYSTWQVEFSGEVTNLASDMPGSASARTKFTGLGGQRVSDDQIESLRADLLYMNDYAPRWAAEAHSRTAFDIWTK